MKNNDWKRHKYSDKITEVYNKIRPLEYAQISDDISSIDVFNVSIKLNEIEILMLSIPFLNNVIDLDENNVVFTYYKNRVYMGGGDDTLEAIVERFKQNKNEQKPT